jgi:hypothetical protein
MVRVSRACHQDFHLGYSGTGMPSVAVSCWGYRSRGKGKPVNPRQDFRLKVSRQSSFNHSVTTRPQGRVIGDGRRDGSPVPIGDDFKPAGRIAAGGESSPRFTAGGRREKVPFTIPFYRLPPGVALGGSSWG